jgi:cytochrome c oxidase subunit 3
MDPALRLTMNRSGLWLFILSESMIFLLLLSVRFVLAGSGHPAGLNQPLALVMTAILIGSGWPARQAMKAIARGDTEGLIRNVWITVGMGTVFLGLMAFEWAETSLSPATAYGASFFVTTGTHGVHVAIGLVLFVSVALQARAGRYTATDNFGVEAAERYWHFVDLVWVFVYPIFYWM